MGDLTALRGLLCTAMVMAAVAGCSDDSSSPSGGAGAGGDPGGDAGAEASGGESAGTAGSSSSGGDPSGGGEPGGGDAGNGPVVVGIGPAGGEVSTDGVSVLVPAGALSTQVEIGVAEVAAPVDVPASYVAASPVYEFTPHGQTFSSPVTLTLGYTGSANTVLRLDDDQDTTWEPVAPATFDNGTATVETSTFSYYVVTQSQGSAGAVAPLYPTNPDFLDYVVNDGPDFFRATGVLCDPAWYNYPYLRYHDCINSGEHRIVPVTGRASCDGLSATDALGAFDWTCEVLGGTATMVSTGFKKDAGMSTVVDFTTGAFKPNSVSVSDGDTVLITTPPEVWWNNSVEIDNDGMLMSTPGTIYLVTQDSAGPYKLTGDSSALLVRPGNKLTGVHVPGDYGRVELRGFGLAFEGDVVGTGNVALYLGGTHMLVRNVRLSGFISMFNNLDRGRLENAALTCAGTGGGISVGTGSLVRNLRAGRCINMLVTGVANSIEDLFLSHTSLGIHGANSVIAGVTVHHTDTTGIGFALGSDGAVLMHATTMHNFTHGLSFYSNDIGVARQVIGLLSSENRYAGIFLDHNAVLRNVASFANTHTGVEYAWPSSSNNTFLGALSIGLNGNRPVNYYSTDPAGCYQTNNANLGDCANSRENTSSGSPNGLLTLADGQCDYDTNSNVTGGFNPPLRGPGFPLPMRVTDDDVNPSDGPDGTAAFASITNWVDFESPYRGWGAEGSATPSCESQGPCSETSTGPAGCQIYDYRLRLDGDAFLARPPVIYPTGANVFTHAFAANGGTYQVFNEALCDKLFTHSVFDSNSQTCGVTFLANAREILGDMRGNDNLLCESDEVCLFTPNMASYQGEGAVQPAEGYTFVNGTISNVTLLEYETNGATLPFRP
jgi:hypothetical protein